ncbi:PEGA domain-containing protein [Caldivirga maquilingensis]|uniref:PEGA domain-containing protein n=1 Tax=Caldivirga maquilingensis (strain ATCC 700844 / DSM 13496 / JCM 10307 / IC-167) TaxID=397948 RepID=A8M9H6_CALMQ|nr:PEGA domain-containing protein [Caldivirga maquilingensis]ABW00857.1 hypothetical protein Cmaq_0003 [Caldivirga maquilingensis IC-167]
MKLQVLVIVTVITLAVSLVASSQLYYGVAYGCGRIVIVGESGGVGLISVMGNSGPYSTVGVHGVSILYSVAVGGCMAVAVGVSQGGGPVFIIYNLTNGAYNVININGTGALYGVAYGDGYFMALGSVNNTGLIVLTTGVGYSIIKPIGFKALYGAAYGDGGFLIVGEGLNGAALGFYNMSTGSLINLSSKLPSNYNYVLYSAAYGPLGFMVVGEGVVNSSGYLIQVPVAGIFNISNGEFKDLSMYLNQYSLLTSVTYIDYEYVFAGSTSSGDGGYGYYSIYGLTPLYNTIQGGNLYLPLILYSITPISPGVLYVVGNDGSSSVASREAIPVIYNVTLLTNTRNALIKLSGPVSLSITPNSTIPLPQGQYTLLAQAEGYYNVTERVIVDSNEVINLMLSRVRLCNVTVRVMVNGTSEPVANASITLVSNWPNANKYVALSNGSGEASLMVVCNNYSMSIKARYFIGESENININSSVTLDVDLTPIVNVTIRAPNEAGEYRVIMSGVVNDSIILGNASLFNLTLSRVGLIRLFTIRLINGTVQYLGETIIHLKPGLNVINITWRTPVIEDMGVKPIIPGNQSVLIYLNLSKPGNLTLIISTNGLRIFTLNETNITSLQLVRNFTNNGAYTVCAYTWSLFNGSIYIDYGPLCIMVNVVLHSELIVMDESGLALKLSGYYLGNETVNVTLPLVLTLGNGTRLIYNGSIFNGEYIANNSFSIRLSRMVNYLDVLWIREYWVRVNVLVNGLPINSTEGWFREGYVIKYPMFVYFNNGTRLINETPVTVIVNKPLTVTVNYTRQYNVTIIEYSRLGLINETWLWVNSDSILRVMPRPVVNINSSVRLIPRTPVVEVTVNEPIIINVTYVIQFLVTMVKYSKLGVFNETSEWVNSDSIIKITNTIIELSNLTRLIPRVNSIIINVTGPMIINESYTPQYLLTNVTTIDESPWMFEEYWVNASTRLNLSPTPVLSLGNSTRLILSGILVNGKPINSNQLVVNAPLNVTVMYLKQWFISISVHTLNNTPLTIISGWVNASSPIISSVKWGNLTIRLKEPLIVNASMVNQPINAEADVAYRVFKVTDSLGLPEPFVTVMVKCGEYSVRQVSNAYGIIKPLVPINEACLLSKPAVGYYSIALIIFTVTVVLLIVLSRRLR